MIKEGKSWCAPVPPQAEYGMDDRSARGCWKECYYHNGVAYAVNKDHSCHIFYHAPSVLDVEEDEDWRFGYQNCPADGAISAKEEHLTIQRAERYEGRNYSGIIRRKSGNIPDNSERPYAQVLKMHGRCENSKKYIANWMGGVDVGSHD